MYTTPATGNSQNPNDLEDYLLGKKRVDKILVADENAKVCPTTNVTSVLFLTALLSSSEPLIKVSLQSKMQTVLVILLQKFARILY